MNLSYISLAFDVATLDKDLSVEYKYEFKQKLRFISNYFSKKIKKERYKTDGSYNMISINPVLGSNINDSKIVPFNVLKVGIPFDKVRYEKNKGTIDCSYYLELLEQGFKKASKFKSIPLEVLLDLIEEFKIEDYKNEWLHKKKRFKKQDMEVILNCEFTTNYFQLVATINQISSKKELVKGVIMKTEPDEVVFEGMLKDIIFDKDIILTDKSDSPIIVINKEAVFNNRLDFKIMGDIEIKKILTYKM